MDRSVSGVSWEVSTLFKTGEGKMRRKMKKPLAFLMAVLMMLSLMGVQVLAENVQPAAMRVFDTCKNPKSLQTAEMRSFFVKFTLFICCTVLYFYVLCDIMRYET